MMKQRTAVLLVNTGTPDAPEPSSVRRYLKSFLSDPRIVELPRILWLPILYGFILPFRPRRSAQRYRKVWLREGSPIDVHLRAIAAAVTERLADESVQVQCASCYGRDSVRVRMSALAADGVERVLVLPMFPQYSPQTVGAVMDAVARFVLQHRNPPAIRTVKRFWDHPCWAKAVAARIRERWEQSGGLPEGGKLLLSYHGIPQNCVDEKGDSYREECLQSSRAIAQELGLSEHAYATVFQSRFGPAPWLRPYTAEVASELGRKRVPRVDVVCPSFVCDCLETLEEINMDARAVYERENGGEFHFIECINSSPEAVELFTQIIRRELAGWTEP